MSKVFAKGDVVLLRGNKKDLLVEIDGEMFRTSSPRGAFNTERLVGMRPGEELRIGSVRFRVYEPDVLDHILNLERGPQMIIPKDSSRIVLELGLTNGSRVVEGGAGSGALSIAILNAVSPAGRLHTYDIRVDHLEKASGNIETAGLQSCWEGKEGDIGKDIAEEDLDAFVVDVPEPERTVSTASGSLKAGGRFCSYVPTVNQMERICLALWDAGFEKVRATEIIERDFSVKKGATRPVTEILAHTGFLIFARWPGSFQS
jgi:tRNA (adenine57-N1/adenine58-N1)-methyltransferase